MKEWNIIIVGFLLTLTGCATHNTPDNLINPYPGEHGFTEIFVDQNGYFYPNDWSNRFPEPCNKWSCWGKHYSLMTFAINDQDEELKNYLKEEQNRIIEDLQNKLRVSDRIYILIHGYNNKNGYARKRYKEISELIELSNRDLVINFYWDGLVSDSGEAGSAKIWFHATGYSQLAGMMGLRKILEEIPEKEVFIITHSRGASVALSALSNPPFNSKFSYDTKKHHYLNICSAAPLTEKGNTIKLILLAPAIGAVDFRGPDYPIDNSFRDLSAQLKWIGYSVNTKDEVLEKILKWPNISDNFNPTDLGFNPKAGAEINRHYGFLKEYTFKDTSSHDFDKYIKDPEFQKMLRDAGIPTTQ